jgi:SRSO17 transposase
MPSRDAAWLQRLDEFMERFRADFRRREQWRWAGVYVQGLLQPGARKTIGCLARRVALPAELSVEDATQALQHFVNQSPWDEGRVWRRCRALLAERLGGGTVVLDELAFVKQGRHSVGVQRQHSAALGGKANCQIAVVLAQVGRNRAWPLALRLYLPRAWLQNPPRLDLVGVPEEARGPQSRSRIALELLDAVRAEGGGGFAVAAGGAFAADAALADELAGRGLSYVLEAPQEGGAAERRSDLPPEEAERRWRDRGRVLDLHRRLGELGLDHFEGRSWRGFHHHACLAALAFTFAALDEAEGN